MALGICRMLGTDNDGTVKSLCYGYFYPLRAINQPRRSLRLLFVYDDERRSVTAIKLRMDSPFPLRDKSAGSGFALARRVPDRRVRHDEVRMRGSNKVFFLIFILLTPTLSSRRGSFFLNLMTVVPERGNDSYGDLLLRVTLNEAIQMRYSDSSKNSLLIHNL